MIRQPTAATLRKCSVDGCGKPHIAKGYCSQHYQQKTYKGRTPARSAEELEKRRKYARDYANKWREDPERKKRRNIQARNSSLRSYGLDLDGYAMLEKLQGGVCAGCGVKPTGRRLNVDHEHVKKYKKMPPEKKLAFVRGLLCHKCNRALGLLGNEPIALLKTLLRLVSYIERYIYMRNSLLNSGVDKALCDWRGVVRYLEAYDERRGVGVKQERE